MTRNQLVTLAQTYNSLMTIETRGNNTRVMAKCLDTLKELITELLEGEERDGG